MCVVCTLYICTSLSSPHTWLREQVCHIVHVIFGVGIQIHLWKSMVGGATCNHGQHRAPALGPHSWKQTCQAEQWQLERSTSYNWTCETDYTSNTQAHRDDN